MGKLENYCGGESYSEWIDFGENNIFFPTLDGIKYRYKGRVIHSFSFMTHYHFSVYNYSLACFLPLTICLLCPLFSFCCLSPINDYTRHLCVLLYIVVQYVYI